MKLVGSVHDEDPRVYHASGCLTLPHTIGSGKSRSRDYPASIRKLTMKLAGSVPDG